MASQVASLYGVLTLDSDKFTAGLKKAKAELDGFGGGLNTAGNAVGNLAGAAAAGAVAVAAAMRAAGVASIHMASQFDRTMTNVRSVTGASAAQMAVLNREVLALGANSIAGPQAAANAMYDIASGVQNAALHTSILKTSMAVAEAGAADLGVTTRGLVQAMNAYGFTAKQAAFAGDVFTRTVGLGVGTMDEFVSALGPISGLAATTGVSFNELGAAMAYMTTKGTTAAMAGTQLKAAMTAMLNPNQAMTAALRRAGLESGSAAIKQLGLVGALNKLYDATGRSTDKMAQLLGSTEALQAAAILTGKDFQDFARTFEDGLNGATRAAQAIQRASFGAQWDIFKNQLEAFAITVGSAVLPALTGLVSGINLGMQAIGAIAPVIGSGISNALGGLLSAISGFTAPISTALGRIKSAVTQFFDEIFAPGTTDEQKRLSKKLGEVLEPDPTMEQKIVTALNNLKTNVGNAIKTMVTDIASSLGVDTSAITTAWNRISTTINAIGTGISGFLGNLQGIDTSGIGTLLSSVGTAIGGLATTLGEGALTALSGIAQRLPELGTTIKNFVNSLIGNDFSGPRQLLSNIGQALSSLGNAVAPITGPLQNLASTVLTGLGTAIQTFINTMSANDFAAPRQILQDIGNALSGLAQAVGPGVSTVISNVGTMLSNLNTGISSFISGTSGVDFSQAKKFLQDVGGALSSLASTIGPGVSGVITEIGNVLSGLGTGITQFISKVSTADFSGPAKLLGLIGAHVGGMVATIGAAGLGTLRGIGDALPALGDAITHFINAMSQAGNGDVGGALDKVGSGMGKLAEGLLKIPKGAADEIGKLFNIDIDKGLNAWKDMGNQLGIIFGEIGNKVRLSFVSIGYLISSGIASLLNGVIQTATGAINGLIDKVNEAIDKANSIFGTKIGKLGNIKADPIVVDIPVELMAIITAENIKKLTDQVGNAINQAKPTMGNILSGLQKIGAEHMPKPAAAPRRTGTNYKLGLEDNGPIQPLGGGGEGEGEGGTGNMGERMVEQAVNALNNAAPRLAAAMNSAISQAVAQIQPPEGLASKLSDMFKLDSTALADIGTQFSDFINQIFGGEGTIMTALAPFQQSITEVFSGVGTAIGTATDATNSFVAALAAIDAQGSQSVLNFQSVSEGSAPAIAGAWLEVVGVFSSLLGVLSNIAGAAEQAAAALGGVGGGGAAGARAGGGPVAANKAYIVGEKGPELFVPGMSGSIIPNAALGSASGGGGGSAGAGTNIQISGPIQIYGVQNPQQMYEALKNEAVRRNRSIAEAM